jgi:hypothetical protein
MSGQGIIYDTSPFNAGATRPALAEGEVRPGRAVSRSQGYFTFAAAILVTGVLSDRLGIRSRRVIWSGRACLDPVGGAADD